MDVPTRSSYVMAIVTPAERPAAASITSVPRSLASAVSPFLAGWMLGLSSFGWPLLVAGGVKIVYDLLLLATVPKNTAAGRGEVAAAKPGTPRPYWLSDRLRSDPMRRCCGRNVHAAPGTLLPGGHPIYIYQPGDSSGPDPQGHCRTKDRTVNNQEGLSRVPEVTLVFWIIKILATTLGETGGDAVSMSMHLGYLISTGIFAGVFLVAVIAQTRAKRFHPVIYWATIIATTTVGTTLADFADRSLGIGYGGGASLLFALLMTSLFTWYRTLGSVSINSIGSPRAELFYWVTIMFSQTLGTALGDWTADTAGLGYEGGALVFSALLLLVVATYYRTKISRTVLFWTAFILTRPLGAVVGDLLDKPVHSGGLARAGLPPPLLC